MVPNPETFAADAMSGFVSSHRLPATFSHMAGAYYVPLVRRLPALRRGQRQLVLGINGAQGTGKSTLADFLRIAAESMLGWNVAVLSIDDFYYTHAERTVLSEQVHPLLMTRGVPGTHDIDKLTSCLNELRQSGCDDTVTLPRFDKLADDRADESQWSAVTGPVDLVILEGWCVATAAQADFELEAPVNALEESEDVDGRWRRYVNDQLKEKYAPLTSRLDYLIFLRAPGFDAIRRWRLQQENKLADRAVGEAVARMDRDQISRFIQFYERLTRANLKALVDTADLVFELDESHSIVAQRGTAR